MSRRPSQPRLLLDFSLTAPGGATTYATSFLQALATAGLGGDIWVLLPPDPQLSDHEGALRAAGVGVLRSRLRPGGSWAARIGAQFFLPWSALRLRATHVFVPREIAPLLVPCRLTLLAHNLWVWDPTFAFGARRLAFWLASNLVARLSVRRAATVLAVTNSLAGTLPHSAKPRTQVVHHGCDMPPLTINEKRSCRLAGDSSVLRVVTIGVLSAHKRYDVVIEMVAKLRAAGVPAELEIWGPVESGEEQERLRQLGVGLLGADPLRGPFPADGGREVLSRADVLALGSSFESFGMPIVEAMRTSTVVVAPRSELVDELCGDCAVTYTEGSAADAAKAVEQALPRLEELAVCGLHRSERFSWHRAVAETVAAARGRVTGDPSSAAPSRGSS